MKVAAVVVVTAAVAVVVAVMRACEWRRAKTLNYSVPVYGVVNDCRPVHLLFFIPINIFGDNWKWLGSHS